VTAGDGKAHDEPQDRLTRMCDEMTKVFDAHPEHREGDKCMVFLDDGKMGGLVLHDYEDQTSAIVDLLLHLRAMFRASGKEMDMIFLGPDGVDSA